MYAAHTKITNLEAEVTALKGKVEEAQADRERVEVELSARIMNKDKDLAAKDVRADTAEEVRRAAEEACNISTSALNVAQNNYAEAQSIVDTLVSESEWVRNHGVAVVANSILNAIELDQEVAALTDVVRAVGQRGGYLECAQHVEEALGQQFGTRHCSVTDQADELLSRAEEVYHYLSLPVMELVTEALKHDDYVARLKSILTVPETVELSDEEDEEVGDGGDE
ncbi:hypothetical protein Hdeb2414_s0003g00105121 [Helianthus debilis subsp. tardiflorus]